MTPNSFLLTTTIGSDNDISKTNLYYDFRGCSEYVAQSWKHLNYVSLPFFILSSLYKCSEFNLIRKIFGDNYSAKEYMIDCINMIYLFIEPLNTKAGKPLFEIFKFKDLPKDKELCNTNFKLIKDKNGIREQSLFDPDYPFDATEFNPEDIIGIKTNCIDIRLLANAQSDYSNPKILSINCRKVQIAHTALRLIYSNGYKIMQYALILHKKYGVDAYYALWLAYNLKYSFDRNSSGYGDLFQYNGGYCSKEKFINRFFNQMYNNAVMQHFKKEKDTLSDYLNINTEINSYDIISICLKLGVSDELSINETLIKDNIKEFSDKINDLLKEAAESIDNNFDKITFIFTKKLFNSVVLNSNYAGIMPHKSKLRRIIFKDENEIALSILSNSKFIEIK